MNTYKKHIQTHTLVCISYTDEVAGSSPVPPISKFNSRSSSYRCVLWFIIKRKEKQYENERTAHRRNLLLGKIAQNLKPH